MAGQPWSEVLRFRRVSDRPPLRVGIMLDTWVVPAWIAHVIDLFQAAPFVEVSGVVLNRRAMEGDAPVASGGAGGKLRRLLTGKIGLKGVLWSMYTQWDDRTFHFPDDPFAPVDVHARLPSVPAIVVEPVGKKIVHRFAEPDLSVISGWNLDVLVRFGFNILKGDILNAARYGVWSYHHGDNRIYRGGPAHFWELYEKHLLSGVILQVLTEALDGGHVIYRTWSSTQHGISLRKNRYVPYWKASAFMLRRLHDLHERGWEWLTSQPDWSEPVRPESKIYKAPSNATVAHFMARNVVRTATLRLTRSHIQEHWFIAFRQDRARFVRNTREIDTTGFRPVMPPRGRFYADPFAVRWKGRDFLFFEDYIYAQERGIVSFVEVFSDGRVSAAETALERPYHLAYPCVFEHDGEMYMIPETMANRTVELYRAVEFPHRWELVRTLQQDIRAIDVTFHHQDGTCYFFATVVERGEAYTDELFLFVSDSLTGEWRSHPLSPVVSDVRRARSGGALFLRDGRLMRPSQDCSVRYGYACVLNEVTKLSPTEYDERPVGTILPDWHPGLRGTHTLNSTETLEVIDGVVHVPRRKVV